MLEITEVGIEDMPFLEFCEFADKFDYERLMYSGYVKDEHALIKTLKKCRLFIAREADEMVGAIWLSDFEKRSCRIHFARFDKEFGRNRCFDIEIGNFVQNLLDKSQEECYDIIWGFTPYKPIVRWAKKFGFSLIEVQKKKEWDFYQEQWVDIYVIQRKGE